MICIPYLSSDPHIKPVLTCIERAAKETGTTPEMAHLILNYFFDELMNQVSRNRIVRIPGFGVIGPRVWKPRTPGHVQYPRPYFCPAYPFVQQVKAECAPDPVTTRTLMAYARSNHPTAKHSHTSKSHRGRTAMAAVRVRIRNDAQRRGLSLPPELWGKPRKRKA